MIVPDANLLIYAFNVRAIMHEPARRWWEGLVNGAERVGIPWVVSTAFVRLLTNRRMLARPVATAQAVDWVSGWFNLPHIVPINPGSQHLTPCAQAAGSGRT